MFLFNRNSVEVLSVELEDGRLRKGYQILWMDKKSKLNNRNTFYPSKEFDTLSYRI